MEKRMWLESKFEIRKIYRLAFRGIAARVIEPPTGVYARKRAGDCA
jgi:hypothetical protein